ncbi:MAG: exodeoxyribonuclease VII small subunit [Pseudomonadales bacterium]
MAGSKIGATEDAAQDSTSASDAIPDFETALAELESLVNQMEGGDLSLEHSLAAFERGVRLTRQCQTALRTAALRIRQLTADDSLEDLGLETLDDE